MKLFFVTVGIVSLLGSGDSNGLVTANDGRSLRARMDTIKSPKTKAPKSPKSPKAPKSPTSPKDPAMPVAKPSEAPVDAPTPFPIALNTTAQPPPPPPPA